MFNRTRRKSGDAAAASTSKAPEGDAITIQRSDGVHHDLNSVFASSALQEFLQSAKEEETNLNSPKDEKYEDHDRISISRSDGITHDLNRVYKASTDNTGETVAPSATGTPAQPHRKPSFTLKEFAKGLSLSSNTPQSTSVKTNVSETNSAFLPKSVRIVHMSDTHNFLNKNFRSSFLPHGDILVHTGNFTNRGTEEEYVQFNQWLGSVMDLYHYRLVVIGNADVKILGNDWDAMKKLLSNATHVLCHSEVTVLGIRFYGCPWHWGHRHNYTVRPGAPSNTSGSFDNIPVGIHVLCSHGPAFRRLDSTTAAEVKEHWGSHELLEAIRRTKPSLHLHGHVKDSRGVMPPFGNAPLTLNSAMVDKDVTVLYATAQVVKASQLITGESSKTASWVFALDSLDC